MLSYLESVKRLAPYIPNIRKYKRRKTLKPQEKSAIARYEKLLHYTDRLIPLTKQQAKDLKDMLYKPVVVKEHKDREGNTYYTHDELKTPNGVRAVSMKGLGTTKIKKIAKVTGDITVIANGRTWVLWKLDRVRTADMRSAAATIFQDFGSAFPIEQIARLAKIAYETPGVLEVKLWTSHGMVGEPKNNFNSFMYWLEHDYSTYKDTDKWVNGLAILVKDTEG